MCRWIYLFILDRDIVERDEQPVKITSKSKKHLTSRHAHEVGLDDPVLLNPNQKPSKYPINNGRTKTTEENAEGFTDIVEEILQSSESDYFSEVDIRGTRAHRYLNTNYGKGEGSSVGIHEEGEFKGQVKKAPSLSEEQLDNLVNQKK